MACAPLDKCSVDGCAVARFCKGYCRVHYERAKRHGDPLCCKKPISPRGSTISWLAAHANYSGDDCISWPFAHLPDGRPHMRLKGRSVRPSRIICEMAHGAAPSDIHHAAHSCGNGHLGCLNPRHLRWATPVENAADKVEHGTVVAGEAHYASKLTAADVREIRRLHGQIYQREIAEKFGVQITAVNKILNGKSWRHMRP